MDTIRDIVLLANDKRLFRRVLKDFLITDKWFKAGDLHLNQDEARQQQAIANEQYCASVIPENAAE